MRERQNKAFVPAKESLAGFSVVVFKHSLIKAERKNALSKAVIKADSAVAKVLTRDDIEMLFADLDKSFGLRGDRAACGQEGLELRCRKGLCNQIPLDAVGAERTKVVRLFLGFNAFGDNAHPQTVG